jgi:hypothetical protein
LDVVAHQQHVAICQQPTCKKEAPKHQECLRQIQFLDQLNQEDIQGTMAAEMAYQK